MDSYLFYRKAGSGPDGWIISPKVEQNMFMVTTREKVNKIEEFSNVI